MPKMKSKRCVRKRFTVTKKKKIKRAKAYKSHILTKKSGKRKRGLRKAALVHQTNKKALRRALPYG